tara:strand:- start:833 stop:1699 length:867 start_codon:yes stop_codon:yes gene_type:complete
VDYHAPESIHAAISLLVNAEGDARVLAGGTDVLVQLREEMIEPNHLIDIKNIAETRNISICAKEVRVGAAVTGAELGEHPKVKALWPGVVEAVGLIGSHQIQSRATMGGNLCNASPAADSVPALIAADGKVVIAGPNGERKISIEDFLIAPGKTALAIGEFVVALALPIPPTRTADAYLRFIPRTEMDIAVVSAGSAITLDEDGKCTHARLAVGAVAPTARLVKSASGILVDGLLDDDRLEQLAQATSAVCEPIDDKRGTVAFRTQVAGVLACRAVKLAWQRAMERDI